MRSIFNNIVVYVLCAFIVLMPMCNDTLKVAGVPVRDILLLIVIMVYLIKILINKELKQLFLNIKSFFCNKFYLALIILFVFMLYSVTYAYYSRDALEESIRFATYLALMFIVTYEVNDEYKVNLIFKSFIVLIGCQVILGIGQFTGKHVMGLHEIRITATLENSNAFGAFLVLFLFPMVFCFLREKHKRKKIVYGTMAFLIFTNIILASTRNAFVGIAFGFVVLALFYSYKFVLAIGGLGILAMFIPAIGDRVKQIFDASQNSSRIVLMKCAGKIISDYPVNGIGNGNFKSYYNLYRQYYEEFQIGEHAYYVVHNSFLKIWAELGIIALIVFISSLGIGFFELKKVAKKLKESPIKSFYIGFMVSFLSFVLMNMIDHFIIVPKVITYFWIILALCQSILVNKINLE